MKFKYIFGVTLVYCFVYGCNNNKFDVDITDIQINLNVKRLDLDLLHNYPDTPDVFQLIEKYDTILDLYSHQILEIGGSNQRDFAILLLDFNNYCNDHDIPSKIDALFGDFSKTKTKLEQAFRYCKYYFPKKQLPDIYTYISNFKQSIVIDEKIIGIGLDKYLGIDCELYRKLGFDAYKIRRMHKEMIVVDCMRAYIDSEYSYNDSIDNLLSRIIHEGKIQYFLDAVLPFAEDSLKFAYTHNQMEWAKHNESNMWGYLIENQLLFSSDQLIIRKMVGEGPFTTLFANNSAPRAGAFLGWKIVHKYMKKHPDISLHELMNNTDYQGILNSAKYKP